MILLLYIYLCLPKPEIWDLFPFCLSLLVKSSLFALNYMVRKTLLIVAYRMRIGNRNEKAEAII